MRNGLSKLNRLRRSVKKLAPMPIDDLGNIHIEMCNRYNAKTVEKVGPDRACAEWILACQLGFIRFKYWKTPISTVKRLPPEPVIGIFSIEELSFKDSPINSHGLRYLNRLNQLKEVEFENCSKIDDVALATLVSSKFKIERLKICNNSLITDVGLCYLSLLKNLRHMELQRLNNVHQKSKVIMFLKQKLPHAAIVSDFE